SQSRTPQHYLSGRMTNISGDALLAAETGLVKRSDEKQLWFGQGLREMFRLIALAQGDESKAEACQAGKVMWASTESRSQTQSADVLTKLKQVGFPFEYLALRFGLTPTEVADLIAMKEREAELDPLSAATALMSRTPDAPTEAPEEEPAEEV